MLKINDNVKSQLIRYVNTTPVCFSVSSNNSSFWQLKQNGKKHDRPGRHLYMDQK